ncbi:MAG: hypothetical protein CTY27_07055 [Methylotenera sp.]|nr:MAG: hypothetical protein CTY27_07055 [Methylotenera sp.]
MILKEKQLTNSQNPKMRAGEEAEKQMAFYLKRAFANSNDCFVLNDLRIIHNDDVAQVDHLVVTPFGLFIIESKSVHGKIIVNKRNEWSRTYNRVPEGMPSPVLQAEAQGKVLKGLLVENKEALLGKALFGTTQKGFLNCQIFVYVAISDKGIIEREHEVKELFKADQICKSIATQLESLKKKNSLLNLSASPVWEINPEETKKVADFLLKKHKPSLEINLIKPVTSIAESKLAALDTSEKIQLEENDACPKCTIGKLIKRKAKTEFLGCSQYPKCKFTSYR